MNNLLNLQKFVLYFRFKNPEPADKWKGVRQATEFGNKCPQSINNEVVGKENCLFLNVYSPRLKFDLSLVIINHNQIICLIKEPIELPTVQEILL